jgi:stage V sporulation protein R
MNKVLEERIRLLEAEAKELGLDFYPINYEVVPQETMLEIMSYGLPTRARHWSYGQSYEYQKMQGEMGHSKVYEVVLNNDPSYAFLLDTNSDIANTLVVAHVIGHSAYFKNNYLFKQTDNKMVYHAAERAQRIEGYIEKHGLEAVERAMDIGFALDKHIDWHKGSSRKPYKKEARHYKDIKKDEFSDVLDAKGLSKKQVKPNNKFPPQPEFDIIWFLTQYSKVLEPWQKDILEIIREESYYFYPQYMTKTGNEGYASFWHAELMHKTNCISNAEHLDFCKIHEKVVQPGGNKLSINPYFLGFSIFTEIKKTWDELHAAGESELTGYQKIFEVVAEEDDVSFIRNYLTKELAEELKLFTYVELQMASGDQAIHIVGTELDMIKESIVKDLYNYRSPLICITGIEDGILQLEHRSGDIGTLDQKHLAVTLEYMYEAWGSPVNIETVDEEGKPIYYTYDELGFSG